MQATTTDADLAQARAFYRARYGDAKPRTQALVLHAPAVRGVEDVAFFARWTAHRSGAPAGPFRDVGDVTAYMHAHSLPSPDEVIWAHSRKERHHDG